MQVCSHAQRHNICPTRTADLCLTLTRAVSTVIALSAGLDCQWARTVSCDGSQMQCKCVPSGAIWVTPPPCAACASRPAAALCQNTQVLPAIPHRLVAGHAGFLNNIRTSMPSPAISEMMQLQQPLQPQPTTRPCPSRIPSPRTGMHHSLH